MAPLARLGLTALMGVMLAAAPTARALAADDHHDASASASASDDDAPITVLREQLVAHRRDASERLRELVRAALVQTVQRVLEAREGMERVITSGYALEELAEPEGAATMVRARPRRLEYVEGASDPLAGL